MLTHPWRDVYAQDLVQPRSARASAPLVELPEERFQELLDYEARRARSAWRIAAGGSAEQHTLGKQSILCLKRLGRCIAQNMWIKDEQKAFCCAWRSCLC